MNRWAASAWVLVLAVMVTGCSREEAGTPRPNAGATPAPVEVGNPDLARLEQQERRIRELELQLKQQEAVRVKAEAKARMPTVPDRPGSHTGPVRKTPEAAPPESELPGREGRLQEESVPLPVVSPIPVPKSGIPQDGQTEEEREEMRAKGLKPLPDADSQIQQPPQIMADPNAPFALTELVVAEGVDRDSREPQGAATEFSGDLEKLYAYMVFRNRTDQERTVTIHWIQNGREKSRIDLRVGAEAKRWRTWGYQNLRRQSAGDWEVVVADEDGVILGTQSFVVVASPRELLP